MINCNMNILRVLEKSLSTDEVESLDALIILQQNSQANWKEFMMKLSNILSQRWNTLEARVAAGIQFSRELNAKEGLKQQDEFDERWMSLHKDVRQWIKDNIMSSFGTEADCECPAVSCAVSIAAIEFQHNEWADLIKMLVQNITNCKSSQALKEASLQCISQMSLEIVGEGRKVLFDNSNAILKAIWIGMKDNKSKVITEAINGLKNSIELFASNFENETERELIMQVVCDVAQSVHPGVKIAAFQCLSRVATIYYDRMEKYMDPRIFAIATEAMKHDDKEIRLEVIEFLREICAIEVELKRQALAAGKVSTKNAIFTNKALTSLMPIFMGLLTKFVKSSEKSPDLPANKMDLTWELYVTFLKELVHCCSHSNVSKFIVDFGMKNLDKTEWKYRNAAVAALSAVITVEGNLIENLLPMFVQLMLQDEQVKVRASASYAIAKLCNYNNVKSLGANQVLLPALVMGLNDDNEVVVSVCESLGCLALSGVDVQSDYFEEIVEKLVEIINRPNGSNRLHKNAACALYYIAGDNHMKGHFVIHKIALAIMKHFRPGAAEIESKDSLSFLHLSLENFMKRVSNESVFQICHMVLAVLITSNNSASKLDGRVVSVLITLIREMGETFIQYFEPLKPFILSLIERDLKSGVDLIAEICSAVGEKISLYCEEIIKLLVAKMGQNISLDAKNHILLLFADLVDAVGPAFKIYMNFAINSITALQSEMDEMHLDTAEFLHLQTEVHKNILKVYTSIMVNLDGDEKTRSVIYPLIRPCIVSIVNTITEIVSKFNDYLDNFTPTLIEEVNDICSIIEPGMLSLVDNTPMNVLVKSAQNSKVNETKQLAAMVEKKIKALKSAEPNVQPKNFFMRGLQFVIKSFSNETLKTG